MDFYGQTVREIRLGKGILQKELYAGVVKTAFSTQFEKGEANLNINDF